jgi:hypothetical protein
MPGHSIFGSEYPELKFHEFDEDLYVEFKDQEKKLHEEFEARLKLRKLDRQKRRER